MQGAGEEASCGHLGAGINTSRLAGEYAASGRNSDVEGWYQKLSTISKQLSDKLASFLRDSLRVLYAGVPVPALRLAAVIFESVYHNRILAALGGGQSEQKDLWESVLYALLSGVLVSGHVGCCPNPLVLISPCCWKDFLDAHQTKAAKDAVGEALFPVLCGICFSLTAPKTGVDLRCTVCTRHCCRISGEADYMRHIPGLQHLD